MTWENQDDVVVDRAQLVQEVADLRDERAHLSETIRKRDAELTEARKAIAHNVEEVANANMIMRALFTRIQVLEKQVLESEGKL